jgi:two-component system, NarL family, nitrate/nitrite response regulator NarL
MSARVIIVDDHPLTREALASLLGAHGFDVCGTASDGQEAVQEAGRLQPDLVLLDLSMPGIDGLSALPGILNASPGSEVVVLTASGTEDNLLAAVRAGAAGYLLKTEPPERIAEFLEGVVHGEAALSGAVARRLLDRVRTSAASRMQSRRSCPLASSRCSSCSTSTWARTRSRSGCTSPSTPCART